MNYQVFGRSPQSSKRDFDRELEKCKALIDGLPPSSEKIKTLGEKFRAGESSELYFEVRSMGPEDLSRANSREMGDLAIGIAVIALIAFPLLPR